MLTVRCGAKHLGLREGDSHCMVCQANHVQRECRRWRTLLATPPAFGGATTYVQ